MSVCILTYEQCIIKMAGKHTLLIGMLWCLDVQFSSKLYHTGDEMIHLIERICEIALAPKQITLYTANPTWYAYDKHKLAF